MKTVGTVYEINISGADERYAEIDGEWFNVARRPVVKMAAQMLSMLKAGEDEQEAPDADD